MIAGAKKNINVELPLNFYERLVDTERILGYNSHFSFLQAAVEGKTDVCWLQVLKVDESDPEGHSVLLLHGEALYSIQNGVYKLIGERTGENLRK